MNLFDIISGNRKLQEEHVTAVLAWLLDPGQSHGCSTLFLKNLLSLLHESEFEQYLSVASGVDIYTKSDSSIHVLMEQKVKTPSGQDRRIDIVISLKCADKPTHIVAIENKIDSSSIKEKQPLEQYEGLKKESDEDTIISYIYLTPDINDSAKKAYATLPEDLLKIHLPWSSKNEESFIGILTSCLENEAKGLNDPLSYETKFILKSFVRFVHNGFKTQVVKKIRTSSEYVQNFEGKLTGLEELQGFVKKDPNIFIGFIGGTIKLREASVEYLITRTYKYNHSLDAPGITKRNWIPANDFFDIVHNLGWIPEEI